MSNTEVPCRLCGSARTVTHLRFMLDRMHPSGALRLFSIVRCLACSVAFTHGEQGPDAYPDDYEAYSPPMERSARRQPTRDWIRRIFFAGQGSIWEKALLFLPYLIFRFRDWYKMRNKAIYERPFRRRGRLLDVGCGRGDRLALWRQFHDKVVGVEPHARTAQESREKTSLDIRQGTLFDHAFPTASFDCVSYCHVLEHVTDPMAELKEAFRVLRKGGEILIWIHNFDSMFRRVFGKDWFPYEVPRHFWHFNPIGISTLMKECGFRPMEIAMDANEWAFRRSVMFRRESGYLVQAWILDHRYVRMLLGLASLMLRRTDAIRIRAIKP